MPPDGKTAGRATDLPKNDTTSRTCDDPGAGINKNKISQNDDSIVISRKTDESAAFSRKNAFSTKPINVPDSTIASRIRESMSEKSTETRRAIEDKYVDIKLVQREIEESGGVIPERQDAYLHVIGMYEEPPIK